MPTNRRPNPAEERAARQARRLRVAELFAQGHTQAEVARQLGVSRQAASRWHARFANGGVDALRSRGPTGPDPKVSDAQLAKVEQVLLEGAIAAGFDTDLWTLERVATVIERLTGVRYHPGHVWWILHQRLGWTVQRPERRASERDEQAIARWVAHECPRIKGAVAESAWLVFFDESAVSLIPPVRRTWSPRGHTPILRHRFGWKKASMAAALGYHPAGTKARLCFHLQKDSYNTERLIQVLEQLGRFYAGQRVVLLWDGLSAHWSMGMRAWLDSQRDWLQAERLPAYAPDLNPVEYLLMGQPQGRRAGQPARAGRGHRGPPAGDPRVPAVPGAAQGLGGRTAGDRAPRRRRLLQPVRNPARGSRRSIGRAI